MLLHTIFIAARILLHCQEIELKRVHHLQLQYYIYLWFPNCFFLISFFVFLNESGFGINMNSCLCFRILEMLNNLMFYVTLLTKHIFFIVNQFVKASAFFPNKHIDRHTTYTNRNLFITAFTTLWRQTIWLFKGLLYKHGHNVLTNYFGLN